MRVRIMRANCCNNLSVPSYLKQPKSTHFRQCSFRSKKCAKQIGTIFVVSDREKSQKKLVKIVLPEVLTDWLLNLSWNTWIVTQLHTVDPPISATLE